jgi:YaiO family outer membrane protein
MHNRLMGTAIMNPLQLSRLAIAAALLAVPVTASAGPRVLASTNLEAAKLVQQSPSVEAALSVPVANESLGLLAANFSKAVPSASAPAAQGLGAPPVSDNPYKSRLEVSSFNNSVNNDFGQWRGAGLHLTLEPSRKLGFVVETIHQWRPGDSEHLNALTVRTEWNSWFSTQLGVSGGGDNDPSGFYPRVRYDATGFLKTPIPGFLLTGGYTRLYYGRPVSGRIARAGGILYLGPLILQGTAFFNNVRPGNRESVSGTFAAQYGREGSYWVGTSVGGGKEAWQTQGVVAQNVEFTGYNMSFFTRKWITKNFGIHAVYNYSIRKTAYRYNGIEFRAFWEF